MGRRFLHVVLMPEDGGAVRNFRITATALRMVLLGLLGLVLALGASLAFHVRTFRDAKLLADLRWENQALRAQFDAFQLQIEGLEKGLAEASQKEQDARILAGLEPVDDQTRRLGIGGPFLQVEASEAIRGGRLRGELNDQGRRLDALQRQLAFQQESYEEVLTTLEGRREKLAHTPTICPVPSGYTLSSGFGPRVDPFTGRSGWHNGLDLRATPGTPVIVSADGEVASVGMNGDFGLTVRIDHGDGLETVFCHLSSATVRGGHRVKRGDRIGSVGNSGRSTGPHLHYEVWKNGRPVDPRSYVLTPSVIVD